jgi:hypothetical protein
MQLEENVNKGEFTFYVDRIPDSISEVLSWVSTTHNVSGPILEVNATQRATIIDANLQDFTITVGEEIQESLGAGSWIRVWGFPTMLEGGVSKNATTLRISSSLRLTQGDQLQVPIVENDSSYTTSYDIIDLDFIEYDTEGYKYNLTLGSGLFRDITSDETLFIRAYPAYFSGRVPLPDYSAAFLKTIGPFLVDWLSGPLVHQEKAVEYFNIQQYRADRSPLTPMLPSGHNGQVNIMPITSEQFLFWQLIEGSINHDGSHAIATCNAEGHFRLVEKFAPLLETLLLYPTGYISCISPSLFNNNESLDIDDGINLVRFEFKAADPFTPAVGKTTIDVSTLTTESQVASAIVAAISSSVLRITASTSGKMVLLVHKDAGSGGNVLIEEGVSDPSFSVQGMAGGEGDLKWMVTVEASAEATLFYRFVPNRDQSESLEVGINTVSILFPSVDPDTLLANQPATHLDLRISAAPGTTIKISDWSLQGSRVSYIETETVVRVETDQWASSFLFLKPLWPSFDLLRAYPDLDKMNDGALLL